MIFMFASTNLVVELGIVLVVLLGWQFAAAEFIGGPIMIVLLAVDGDARDRSARASPRRAAGVCGRDRPRSTTTGRWSAARARQAELERAPWHVKLRSRRAGRDAASYTMADLSMLRRELVIGYLIAGFLAILVPNSAWNAVFLHGHGIWTSIENAVVGPFIAIISFVCSIGNVPLAAALWYGGISFGGVIAFIFADLITLPLLLIYREVLRDRA